VSRRLGVAAALVEGRVVPGDVEVVDGRIAAVGASPPGRSGLAVAGFVDLQVNGYAGVELAGADAEGYRTAGEAMARSGVVAYLATFPSLAPERYEPALRAAAEAHRAGGPGARVLGVHLEGPFLSPDRRGAHPRRHLRAVDPGLLAGWRRLAPVRLVTLAPELDGALDLVRSLVADGVVVSSGHTDATAEVASEAVSAGVRAHTHVWNAHRPITSRDPGPGAVALTDERVAPCLIADLAHVAGPSLALALAAASDRYVLVTDAVWAAGLPDGAHDRGGRELVVGSGAARLADGTLAGSATTLDGAVRNVVALGRPLEEALAAVTSRPASLLGEADLGRIRPGGPADVVVLDDALEVTAVLLAGVPAGGAEG
jgi:N-acetylglucosamine-6-phosphate deacetylase